MTILHATSEYKRIQTSCKNKVVLHIKKNKRKKCTGEKKKKQWSKRTSFVTPTDKRFLCCASAPRFSDNMTIYNSTMSKKLLGVVYVLLLSSLKNLSPNVSTAQWSSAHMSHIASVTSFKRKEEKEKIKKNKKTKKSCSSPFRLVKREGEEEVTPCRVSTTQACEEKETQHTKHGPVQ